MGPAGAGSLGQVVNAAIAGRARMAGMREFFEGVGQGDNAGVWQEQPREHPGFHEQQLRKLAKKQHVEEPV